MSYIKKKDLFESLFYSSKKSILPLSLFNKNETEAKTEHMNKLNKEKNSKHDALTNNSKTTTKPTITISSSAFNKPVNNIKSSSIPLSRKISTNNIEKINRTPMSFSKLIPMVTKKRISHSNSRIRPSFSSNHPSERKFKSKISIETDKNDQAVHLLNKTKNELISIKLNLHERIKENLYKKQQIESEFFSNKDIKEIMKLQQDIEGLNKLKDECLLTQEKLLMEINDIKQQIVNK